MKLFTALLVYLMLMRVLRFIDVRVVKLGTLMKNITLPDEEILIGSQFRETKYKVIIFINVPHYTNAHHNGFLPLQLKVV
ncbi:MAG: hypothetical protein QME78_12395 [Thermodesulfobacteriota bacterium]|nr:hypothetical protein [Thermodesulfobacteriota bacterium]